jgi:4-amino-4-deoxy-L-arabinose transferase-like glycosyltransferase
MEIKAFVFRYRHFFIGLVGFLLFSAFSAAFPIYILDEAKNSEAAREMLVSQNYFVPTFNGELRTDKPPLHYFLMMLSYSLFGVGPFAARFFSAVAGAIMLMLITRSIERYLNWHTASIAALVICSSLLFAQEFHLAVPDPFLILFVTASLLYFFDHDQQPSKRKLLLAYSFMGLGLLSKGPIALVIVALTALLYLGVSKKLSWRYLITFYPFLGVLFSLCIAAPWYIGAHVATNGAFTEGFFLDHNLNRFSDQKEGHGGPFILTTAWILVGLLPFGVWLIPAWFKAFRARWDHDFMRFCSSVGIVIVVFFSFSDTKLPNYPMPAFAFLGVLIADYLVRLQEHTSRKTFQWGLISLIVLGFAAVVGAYFGLNQHPALSDLSYLSFALLPISIGALALLFRPKGLAPFQFVLTLALNWLLIGWLLWGWVFPTMNAYSPVAKALPLIADKEVVVFKRLDPAFLIQTQRTFDQIGSAEALQNRIAKSPETLILTNTKDTLDLKFLIGHYELILEAPALFEDNSTRIWRVTKEGMQSQ